MVARPHAALPHSALAHPPSCRRRQDYVFLSYFLICTSTFLKIRWWVGTGLLATPTVAVQLLYPSSPAPSAILPHDAFVHIVVAWAVGGLMAYLSDWYRR